MADKDWFDTSDRAEVQTANRLTVIEERLRGWIHPPKLCGQHHRN